MLKKILVLIIAFSLVVALFLQAWFIYTGLYYNLESLIYWLALANWLVVVQKFHISSFFNLGIGLCIISLFALLHGISSSYFFEPFIRFGFIFWYVGLIQALKNIVFQHHD